MKEKLLSEFRIHIFFIKYGLLKSSIKSILNDLIKHLLWKVDINKKQP